MRIGTTVPTAMTPAQRAVYDEIERGPRGCVPTVLLALLDAPELALLVQAVGRHIIYESTLPADVRELAVLTVVAAIDSGFEWDEHLPTARDAGVPQSVCDAAQTGAVDAMPSPYRETARLCLGFLKPTALTDRDVDAVKSALGPRAVTELAALSGYYTLLTHGLRAAGLDRALSRQ